MKPPPLGSVLGSSSVLVVASKLLNRVQNSADEGPEASAPLIEVG